MIKVLFISIGLVLVIEGILYFILAENLENLLKAIKRFDKQKIKTFSLSIALTGLCLIYFTFKFYGEVK
tara:strand:- start:649 stop:855 length:207 start_codon:yes stop_codon:yes gene_type:complete